MKHITESYGQPDNMIECTDDEYEALSAFLLGVGVELRACVRYKGTVTAQVRNVYRDTCRLYDDNTGAQIIERAKKDITEGLWLR